MRLKPRTPYQMPKIMHNQMQIMAQTQAKNDMQMWTQMMQKKIMQIWMPKRIKIRHQKGFTIGSKNGCKTWCKLEHRCRDKKWWKNGHKSGSKLDAN